MKRDRRRIAAAPVEKALDPALPAAIGQLRVNVAPAMAAVPEALDAAGS